MKLKYIDILRSIAVLGVLTTHCTSFGNNIYFPTLFLNFVSNGSMGVQLFYIVSAFTLFLSMENRFYLEKYPIKNFFIRRFFRIAPMYYIAICYYLFVGGLDQNQKYWLGGENSISIGNIFSNIFFVHGFNPYWINSLVPGGWSIAVEMLFYCLFPFLFVRIKNIQHAFYFLLGTIFFRYVLFYIFSKINLISSDELWTRYLFLYFPNQLPIFAQGILFYYILKDDYILKLKPKIILGISIILFFQFNGLNLLPQHFQFGILFIIFGIALSKLNINLINNSLLLYIGKISYSMYFVHFAILYWMSKFNFIDFITVTNSYTSIVNFSLRLIILIILTIIISSISYWFIEIPMQNFGKNLIKKFNLK